jgi:hypothetical protein
MSHACKKYQRQKFGILMLIAASFLTSLLTPCLAQQPLQDGNGEGTLLVGRKGFLQFNLADSTAHFGWVFDNTKNDFSFGFDASARPSGKRASLISNNAVAADAQFSISVGKKFIFAKKFDPYKIYVTEDLLANMQKVLRTEIVGSKAVIGPTVELPSPEKLKTLVESVGLSDKISNQPNLITYIRALVRYCAKIPKTDDFCSINDGRDIGSIERIFDTTKIFKKDETNPSVKDLKNFAIGFDRLVFKAGYGRKKYTLYDPSAPFDSQFSEKDFQKPSAQLIYFAQINANKLFGVSLGVEKANNSDQLTETEVTDETSIVNGNVVRTFKESRTGLVGDYQEYTRAFVNTDFAWFPGNSRIGLNFFTRSGLTGKKTFRPGLGVFFSQKGSPTRINGGVSISVNNNGKLNIALIGEYNF